MHHTLFYHYPYWKKIENYHRHEKTQATIPAAMATIGLEAIKNFTTTEAPIGATTCNPDFNNLSDPNLGDL